MSSAAAYTFVPMGLAHVESVAEIEASSFTTPWSAETFRGLVDRSGVAALVMTDTSGSVVGYAVLWCILEQGELANIAIAPDRRGEGLGRRMLHHVVEVARERGVEKLFLEVRASNAAALALYEDFGFARVGMRRNYYERPREDALVMLSDL